MTINLQEYIMFEKMDVLDQEARHTTTVLNLGWLGRIQNLTNPG
jgi:hypothetical protein